MDDLIEDYLDDVKESRAENTFQNRRTDLRHFDAFLDREDLTVTEVEPRHVHKFLRQEAGEYADLTVRGRFGSVDRLYSFLTGVWDVMEESPVEDLDRKDYFGNGDGKKHQKTDVVYVSPEEKDALLEHVPNPKLRNELMIRMLWQTGIRRGELVSIEVENIDREARAIDVWASKTGDWRTVFYQPSLDTLLDQWIDVYRDSYNPAATSPYLFVSTKSEKLRPRAPNRMLKQAAEDAGIQEVMYEDADGRPRVRITAHALRHGHAVHALKSGIDIRTVQKHMGHAKIETTMKYLRLLDDDVRESYQQFGAVGA
jgi:integrase/recombinase XerD